MKMTLGNYPSTLKIIPKQLLTNLSCDYVFR